MALDKSDKNTVKKLYISSAVTFTISIIMLMFMLINTMDVDTFMLYYVLGFYGLACTFSYLREIRKLEAGR